MIHGGGVFQVRELVGYGLVFGLFLLALLMVAGAADGQYDDVGSAVEWLSGLLG